MSKQIGKKISLGVCYYPEHWGKEMWKDDLLRMLDHGIQTVRIAEFAWSKFELTEGQFTYDFFDEFLEIAKEVGMKVIFCTPTATPPAWLTKAYPEVLNKDINGVTYQHGGRRHYTYNSPKYIELCKRIVEKLALHYASHVSIIGWQIDNEINCHMDVFYSEADTHAFRAYIQEKYKTLHQLNEAWGTVFWNQTYTSWDEIDLPKRTPIATNNPHLMLDYIRFISESARRFVKMQSDILKKYIKKDDFITTNGMFDHLDNHQMSKESLDVFTYDSYPNFAYCLNQKAIPAKKLKDRNWSRNLTEVRSISPHFGIMEQQSGANGWNTQMETPAPKPGQMTLWTLQSIAHGADYVSFFRWRTCTIGTEMYWHGILDYSNRDTRRLKELKDLHHKIETIEEIVGSRYEARVGIIKDYDNVWDEEIDIWHKRINSVSEQGLFEALQGTHTPFDYIYLTDNTTLQQLQSYQVLFYPHAIIMTEQRARILKEYVCNGGKIIFGCHSSYKDINGKCVMLRLPGLLQDLTATDVEEYSFVALDDEPIEIEWEGERIEAKVFTDFMQPLGAGKVVGRYCSGEYEATPALIQHAYGKGEVYYFGSTFTEEVSRLFLRKLSLENPYEDYIRVPQECEIAVRSKEDKKYIFILNYSKKPVTVELKKEMLNMYHGKMEQGIVSLEGYGSRVFKCL
ncbi:beta-galactosidase [Sporanaerobium hydrogeniformans]|uniref:Beta-galactosidase n=1 Tax=Sporanaerobium hydrogeniformans TaxID=3072179 RepID=A0AC61D6C6_9FIRM|nr:beta-galactosidase [Sporanaerobium hydrogeniformans]PHV69239.1 beta-galactosidase [Sporanaerobium hydrogeniformans]